MDFRISKVKTIRVFLIALIFCIASLRGFATIWTTGTAGAINTLSNWTNGSTSPSSFTTPGDIWVVTRNMTIPSTATWTVGTSSSTPDTVIFRTGGVLLINGSGTVTINIYGNLHMNGGWLNVGGAGGTGNINVYGNYVMNAGHLTMGGSGTALNLTTYGNYTMNADTVMTGSAGGTLKMNIHGDYRMTGGVTVAGGAGASLLIFVYGNYSNGGTSAMTSTGASTVSTVHLALPSSSGTMLIHNTSTGTWSGTNIYVDTSCTAQLDSNFRTNTGAAAFGLTVNGTLICPAADTVTGNRMFTLNGVATLKVAATTGINGAIVTTGTTTFNPSANYEFNGTAAQITGSYLPATLTSPSTLTINDTAGVTLSQNTRTTGVLAFTNGILNTGSFTMSVPGAASAVTGAGATTFVNGTLIKSINGLTVVNYEVGDNNYAPMLLTLSSAGTAGGFGLIATHGLHPSVASSGLSTSYMANHYWKIISLSAAGPSTVIPTATYNAIDVIGGTNAAFVTQQYVGSSWLGSPLATTNTSSPYTSAPNSGIALSALAGQYIFGKVNCGTAPISGATTVCAGATITLTDATTGGTWSSGATSIATVSSAGVVTGVAAGTATISYSVSGCTVTSDITVTAAPVAGTITGVSSACIGFTTLLTDTVTGGVWSSSATGIATVSTTGMVTGLAAGTAVISYTVTNGCGSASATMTVTVSPTLSVAPITGIDSVCPAHTTTLSDATSGGIWSSNITTIASVSGAGIVTGIAPGYDTIVYTVANSCGTASSKLRIKVRPIAACNASVSMAGIESTELHVYPNPGTGEFTINILPANDDDMHITITNILGQKVKEFTVQVATGIHQTIELKLNEPAGVYLLYATGLHGSITTKVVIDR